MTPSPDARPVSPDVLARLTADLQTFLGDRCVTSQAVRAQHANTVTWLPSEPPDIVVWPQDAAEAQRIVKLCATAGVAMIPFGAGTSLEGHVNAPRGGVSIDTALMKAIVAVHPEDQDCVVEPGVTRKELNEYLRDTGLFFPIDPGADASLGGMVSTRASGTNAVRYGTMRDVVLALDVILPNGEMITTGGRARKSSAGYDLTRLFVGAEGTLGLITRITLRLAGIPEAVSAGVCPFPDVRAACDTAIACIQSGIPIARVELVDALAMRGFNLHSGMQMPETPVLFIEFHGTEAGIGEQTQRFQEIAEAYGGGPCEWATQQEEMTRLWQARHDAYWAALALRPGCKALSTDVCVPISRLAECVEETQADIAAAGLVAPIVGHVGDGNFHVLPLFMPDDAQEKARLDAFLERLVDRALAMEGTCTGEHGIGQGKRRSLEKEHGATTVSLMRSVKLAVDPANLMNPGKIVA